MKNEKKKKRGRSSKEETNSNCSKLVKKILIQTVVGC